MGVYEYFINARKEDIYDHRINRKLYKLGTERVQQKYHHHPRLDHRYRTTYLRNSRGGWGSLHLTSCIICLYRGGKCLHSHHDSQPSNVLRGTS